MRAQTILFLSVDGVKEKLDCRPYRGGGKGQSQETTRGCKPRRFKPVEYLDHTGSVQTTLSKLPRAKEPGSILPRLPGRSRSSGPCAPRHRRSPAPRRSRPALSPEHAPAERTSPGGAASRCSPEAIWSSTPQRHRSIQGLIGVDPPAASGMGPGERTAFEFLPQTSLWKIPAPDWEKNVAPIVVGSLSCLACSSYSSGER